MCLLGLGDGGGLGLVAQGALTVLGLLAIWSLVVEEDKLGVVNSKVGHGAVALAQWVSIDVSVLADLRITGPSLPSR